MNTKPSPAGKVLAAISASALLLAGSLNSSAADGAWSADADGNWSDPTKWLGSILADGAGSTAYFTNEVTALRTVTLDSARTVGNLVFGDADSVSTPGAGWILAGSALTLDAGVATPVITVSNLQNTYGTNDARIMAAVSSALGFVKKGTNTLTLTAANSFNAPVQVDEGLVAVGIAAALGTNAVVMNGGGVGIIAGAYGNTNNVISTGSLVNLAGANYDNLNGPWIGSASATMNIYSAYRFTLMSGNASQLANFRGTISLSNSPSGCLFRINLGGGPYDMSAITLDTGTGSGRFASRITSPANGVWKIGALKGVGGQLQGSENSGGTMVVNEVGYLNTDTTFGGQIRAYGSGREVALTKVGTGRLTLTNSSNSYVGNTTIRNGVLALSGSGALTATPRISILSGAVFDVSGGTTVWGPAIAAQVLEGSGVVTGDVAAVRGTISPGTSIGTLSFSNNLALTEGVTNWFEITGPGVNDSIVVAGDLTLNSLGGGVVVRVVPTGAFIPNGTYPLFKWGGSLPAGDTNSLALQYVPQSGTLTLEQDLATKQIFLKVVGVVTPANLTWRGDGAANDWDYATPNWRGGGTVFKDGDNVTFDDSGSNNVPVNLAAVVNSGSLVVNATKDYVFSSTSGGRISGAGSLLKTNSGRLTLITDNDYRDTTIAAGTVQLGDGATTAGSLGTGTITNNGILIYNRPDAVTNTIAIHGTGAVVQRGGELLVLGGNNSYSGGTTISNNSTVLLGSGTALGAGPVKLAGGTLRGANNAVGNAVQVSADSTIDNAATVRWDFTSSGITRSGGTLTISGAGMVSFSGTNLTYDGPMDLQTSFASYNGGGLQVYNGVISGPGEFRRHLGGGTARLNGPNTYSGGTWFRQGTLEFGVSSVSSSPPTIDSGPIGTGLLTQDATSGHHLIAFGGARTVANPILLNTAAGALAIGGTNDLTLSGGVDLGGADKTIQADNTAKSILSGDISNGNLIKTGDGTLYLNGNNYANSTLVSAGTLGGTGTFSGPVTVAAGATLAPGMSVGTLTINSDLTIAGNLSIEVNKSLSPSNDLVSVSGVLTNAGTGAVTVKNLGPALNTGDKFTLFSKPLLNGNALSVTGAGRTWANNLASDGSITVTGVVPPPTLNFTQVGTNLQFSWSGDFKLQAQTNAPSVGLSTNWFDYPGGGSSPISVPVDAANGSVFFRLVSTW